MQKNISDNVSEIEQKLVIQFGATKALELIGQIYKLSSEEREKLKSDIEKNIKSDIDLDRGNDKIVLSKRVLDFANELRRSFQNDCKELSRIKMLESFKEANEFDKESKLKLEQAVKSYLELLGEKFSYDMPHYFYTNEKPDKNTLNYRFGEKILPLFDIAFDPNTGEKVDFLYPVKGKFESCYITNAFRIWQGREVHVLYKDSKTNTSYRPVVPLTKFIKMINEGQVRKM